MYIKIGFLGSMDGSLVEYIKRDDDIELAIDRLCKRFIEKECGDIYLGCDIKKGKNDDCYEAFVRYQWKSLNSRIYNQSFRYLIGLVYVTEEEYVENVLLK